MILRAESRLFRNESTLEAESGSFGIAACLCWNKLEEIRRKDPLYRDTGLGRSYTRRPQANTLRVVRNFFVKKEIYIFAALEKSCDIK